MTSNLDPSSTFDRITFCELSPDCAHWFKRAQLAGERANALDIGGVPAIWQSLQPARAAVLSRRAQWRYRAIRSIYYDRYVQAASALLSVRKA